MSHSSQKKCYALYLYALSIQHISNLKYVKGVKYLVISVTVMQWLALRCIQVGSNQVIWCSVLYGGGEVILNDVMRFKRLLPHWLLLSGLDSWRIIHQQQYDDAWGIKETDIRQMMMRGCYTFPPCAKRILLLDCTVTSFTTLPWRGQPEKWVFMSCSKPWLWAGQWEVTDGFADFRCEIY